MGRAVEGMRHGRADAEDRGGVQEEMKVELCGRCRWSGGWAGAGCGVPGRAQVQLEVEEQAAEELS